MPNVAEIAYIIIQTKNLESDIRDFKAYLFHSSKRLLSMYNINSSVFNKERKEILILSLNMAKNINKKISNLNKWLGYFLIVYNFKKIPKINLFALKAVINSLTFEKITVNASERLTYINKRLKELSKGKPKYVPKEENFYLKINILFRDILKSLETVIERLMFRTKKFFKHTLHETKYGIEIDEELASVFSIDYPELALFIAGRILENAIKDYMILLRKNGKIDKSYKKIKEMRAEDRLNYLCGKWIKEKDVIKLKSIKFDRNIIAHYNRKSFPEIYKDAESEITIAINILERINSKIEQQKRTIKSK